MIFADSVDVLLRLSFPIGIAIGALILFAVPSFRKMMIEQFRAGQQMGKKLRNRKDDVPEDGPGT